MSISDTFRAHDYRISGQRSFHHLLIDTFFQRERESQSPESSALVRRTMCGLQSAQHSMLDFPSVSLQHSNSSSSHCNVWRHACRLRMLRERERERFPAKFPGPGSLACSARDRDREREGLSARESARLQSARLYGECACNNHFPIITKWVWFMLPENMERALPIDITTRASVVCRPHAIHICRLVTCVLFGRTLCWCANICVLFCRLLFVQCIK